jgi:hypothetical protein
LFERLPATSVPKGRQPDARARDEPHGSAGGAMSKEERFVQGLAIMFAIMWLVSLIDDGRPSVRRECRAHPTWDYVITGEDDAGEHVAWCRHSGLAALIVEVPTLIVEAISDMRARLIASDDPVTR